MRRLRIARKAIALNASHTTDSEPVDSPGVWAVSNERIRADSDASVPLPDCDRWIPAQGPYIDRDALLEGEPCVYYRSDIDALIELAKDDPDVIIRLR